MPARPELVDNQQAADGTDRTHGTALAALVADLGPDHAASIATGYVNLGGLHHLATLVADGRGVRLLLGAEPDPGLGADLPLGRFQLALASLEAERNISRFPPSRAARALGEVDAWLDQPTVEVRRYMQRFLHGKAYLFGDQADPRAALVTSANLTAAGLFANLELGMARYDPGPCRDALAWFDQLWHAAQEWKADLRALLFPDPGFVDPETVYLRALLELYGEDLDEPLDVVPDSTIALAPFQRSGYERARRIVAEHHGVVYADGVGTGKTEIGLAFVEQYALREGRHALVVCPAQLREMWQHRLHQSRLAAQVISFQELASDEQLGGAPGRRVLAANRETYRLVVVDEGHALRNPGTSWYRAVERLLGGERKDLVLLTATPINNGLMDLYHMVMAFSRHDRAFLTQGIESLRGLFLEAGARSRDAEDLNPDLLFPLADAVSVRRDRRFIEAQWPDATFPNGMPVRFPRPTMSTRRYDLDRATPGLVDEVVRLIDALTLARYQPGLYDGSGLDPGQAALAGLLRSQLLKRFESSWWACLRSVRSRIDAHRAWLAAWDDQGVVLPSNTVSGAAGLDLEDVGLADWVAEQAEATGVRSAGEFDGSFRRDVATDLRVLEELEAFLARLQPEDDPKLAALMAAIAASEHDKVIVFATFGDTIDYIDRHLPDPLDGRQRVVVVGGRSAPDERTALLARFSPHTVVRPDYQPDDEVDLLLSTDVLSEGQNLQQAGCVVSYDMPWNPQRVVQRNGRIIRLLSPHAEVALVTLLPESGDLETILRLEATIRFKILAAGVYGLENPVLEDVESALVTYGDRLAGGDESLLDDGQAGGGTATGEELRALVQRAIAEGEADRLRRLPWGIGAAFYQGPGIPSRGNPGVFFACRTSRAKGDRRWWRFVEMGPDGLVIVTTEADMLRRINPGPAAGVDLTAGSVDLEAAWTAAATDIVAAHNRLADPRRAEESIGPAQLWALSILRDPTVAIPPGADQADEALSDERSSSVRHTLNELRAEVDAGRLSRDDAATRIVQLVIDLGLQAIDAGAALEAITEDDLGVVCWMAVLGERARTGLTRSGLEAGGLPTTRRTAASAEAPRSAR
ncbi:MAG: helicase-related protein [Acidimicrobiales bacterium]